MEWDLLINPVVGGIIGYGTNYLAIKMLFRPHHTKYIGKVKIPFTPGLIPKEKATLARQMGEITEEYLLTEEMLVGTLTGPKVKDVLLKFSEGIPKYMEESDGTIGEIAKTILGDNIKTSTDAMSDQFALEIITMLRSKEVIDLVVPYLSNEISKIVRDNISSGLQTHAIAQYITELGLNSIESDQAKDYIYTTLDELEEKVYSLLRHNAATIGKGVIVAVGQGEEAEKIKETFQHWIDENFNPMVSMFIKVDKIYEGIIDFSKEALEDPERNIKFGELLCTVVKGIKESEPDYKDKAINLIKDQINEGNIEKLIPIIVEEIRKREEATKVQIEKWIYSQWDGYINTEAFLDVVKKVIEGLMKFVGDTSLRNISMIITSDTKNKINEKIFSCYKMLIENNSKEVAKVMDISNIVESKINEYSSEEAEKVILSVVKEQLRGITWIGALLGGIIGILSNFIR